MSDVANYAKAELALRELEQRTRLLKLVRNEPNATFRWFAIPTSFLGAAVGAAIVVCPWDIPDRVLLLVVVCLALVAFAVDRIRLERRFNALVKILERDGMLRDRVPATGY